MSRGGRWLVASARRRGRACRGLRRRAAGADYKPAASRDPCAPATWPTGGTDQSRQQAALSALDGAACKLGVSSEAAGRWR